jgi:NTE family protein
MTNKINVKTKDTPNNSSSTPKQKKVVVALQGGGSHGAFTWGVLDALLEKKDFFIEGISGTSAGAMNAVAATQGLLQNGNKGAQQMLQAYWEKIGEKGRKSPLQFSPLDKAVKHFDMSNNPVFKMMQSIGGMFSPYQLNPKNVHPMRDVVEGLFDFKLLQEAQERKVFLCATHIATGKLKIFTGKELTSDAVLASACVPSLFQAIEVNGEFYWDGGFIGNPAIYPLLYNCDAVDVIVIQIRRVHDHVIPRTVHDINNRLGEITQNACLTREMRSIAYITKLIEDGVIPKGRVKHLHMHLIRDDEFFGTLDRSSGFSADPDFLAYLRDAGRRCGEKWIKEHYNNIGVRTTANLGDDFVS